MKAVKSTRETGKQEFIALDVNLQRSATTSYISQRRVQNGLKMNCSTSKNKMRKYNWEIFPLKIPYSRDSVTAAL